MVHVSPEVWLYIATFIPVESLRDLISVNAVFFNLAMDERYRDVEINFTSDEMKSLDRLRDPEVSKRVRCLRVNPNFSQDFQNVVGTKSQPERFWKRGFNAVRKRIRDSPVATADAVVAAPNLKYSVSQQALIQAVVDTVSHLSNVCDFDISWWDPTTVQHLRPFLPIAWTTFGANLRRLSLAGDLEGLRQLASSPAPFVVLQELAIEFVHNVHRIHDMSDTATLVEVLAPFVNGLSPTLQHISITSWASLELSLFFQKLSIFPRLRELTIRVSFDKAFPSDTSGLTNLLHNHASTLKCVALRFNPSSWMAHPSREEHLVNWMTEIALDESILSNLEVLQIYPTVLAAGFYALLVYLSHSANTLTTLTVRDRYFAYEEVEMIVTTFIQRPPESRLNSLRLNVHNLSIRLIDLLAATLPTLSRLTLIVGEGWTEQSNNGAPSTPEMLQVELRNRTYTDWKLNDIGIWKGGAKAEGDLMTLLAERIPSLRSFWGQGDLQVYGAVL